MKTVGIVAEYNPFHNGHAYQIAKAKELTNADYCIVVMSGDFVQRGIPAMMSKYLRAEAALKSGADLVLELPVCYALGSAEYFALGAVTLLDKLGIVDSICFGSECGNMALLLEFAERLLQENDRFKETLKRKLKNGASYPTARNAALLAAAPHLTEHIGILESPNNILAIEYCKALKRRKSKITPYTLLRNGSSYHDASLDTAFSSALAIREALLTSGKLSSIQGQVPGSAYEILESHYQKDYPVWPDDISLPLHYQLLSQKQEGYTSHPDIDSDFSDRIVKKLSGYRTFTEFCDTLKTKNITYTRVSRSLLHILLHINESTLSSYRDNDYIYYARMLGFCSDAAKLLHALKEKSQIPLLSKLADAPGVLSGRGNQMLEEDIFASNFYQSIIQHKFSPLKPFNEYQRQIIRV